MRKLSVKQKKLLTQEWKHIVYNGTEYPDVQDIPDDVFLTIDNIKPHEDFWNNARRLFDDLNSKKRIDTTRNLWYN